jgi:hypothetical protein
MSNFDKVRQLIGELPLEVVKEMFVDFRRDVQKFEEWSTKADNFKEDLDDPNCSGEDSFQNVLGSWKENKSTRLFDKMVDRLMQALEKQGLTINLKREDFKDYLVVICRKND